MYIVEIDNKNLDKIEKRINCIKDLIAKDFDMTIAVDDVEILKYKDSYIRFKLYYEYENKQNTKEVIITDFEINDLNMLYRYIKSNIVYDKMD